MANADVYWLTAQRSIYETRNHPCDIVMFGDSTAIVGLDPRVISAATHLSACNIGVTVDTMRALGNAPLDEYLARNPRPKYLLLQYNVGNLEGVPSGNPKDETIESLLPLLRYGKTLSGLRHLLRNPDSFIGLMHYTYVLGPLNLRSRFIKKDYPILTKQLGAYTVIPSPPLTACPASDPVPPKPVDAAAIAWIHHLREKYADKADQVLVDVAPTSSCNKYYEQWRESLKGEIDNTVTLYPLKDFVDIHFHVGREGAMRFSRETAQELLKSEQIGSSTK